MIIYERNAVTTGNLSFPPTLAFTFCVISAIINARYKSNIINLSAFALFFFAKFLNNKLRLNKNRDVIYLSQVFDIRYRKFSIRSNQ